MNCWSLLDALYNVRAPPCHVDTAWYIVGGRYNKKELQCISPTLTPRTKLGGTRGHSQCRNFVQALLLSAGPFLFFVDSLLTFIFYLRQGNLQSIVAVQVIKLYNMLTYNSSIFFQNVTQLLQITLIQIDTFFLFLYYQHL